MSLRRIFITIAPTVAIGSLVLLTAALITVRSTSAQSGDSPTCSTGAAVPDPDDNPGLVSDCEALLASRDTLTGDASLNWSADTPIRDWDSVGLSGSPERVTRLSTVEKELTGTIPAELGQLSSLETLNLGNNQLTGTIPAELGQLSSLETLNLGNNQLLRSLANFRVSKL